MLVSNKFSIRSYGTARTDLVLDRYQNSKFAASSSTWLKVPKLSQRMQRNHVRLMPSALPGRLRAFHRTAVCKYINLTADQRYSKASQAGGNNEKPSHDNTDNPAGNFDAKPRQGLPKPPSRTYPNNQDEQTPIKFPHLTHHGTAHMIPITAKSSTARTAVAVCTILFTNTHLPELIAANQIRKGDVLAVARIAGIMAAKRTAELLPLCHPVPLTHVEVEAEICNDRGEGTENGAVRRQQKGENGRLSQTIEGEKEPSVTGLGGINTKSDNASLSRLHGKAGVRIKATVECIAQTGVEMEALCAVNVAALTVYDMCKALDKHIVLGDCRVIEKKGGRSGDWGIEDGG